MTYLLSKTKKIQEINVSKGIESALKDLVERNDSGRPAPTTKEKPKSNIHYVTLKDAVYDGMAEYFKAEPGHTGILSEENILKIHSVINKVDSRWVKEHWDKEDEKATQNTIC